MEEKLLEGRTRLADKKKKTGPIASGLLLVSGSSVLRRYSPLGLMVLLALAPIPLGESTAIVRVLDLIAIYALLALGLNVVVGFAGLLDLGYVAFYAVGAYLYAFMDSARFGLHLPFPLTLVLGGGLAALFGVLLGIPVLRLRGDYLAIVTLGFGEMIRIFLNNLDMLTNGPQGISRIDAPNIGGYILSTPTHIYYLLLTLLVMSVVTLRRLENSRVGRAWAAIREDEGAARAMGVNTRNLKLMAFAIGATTAGLAGVVFSSLQGFVSPDSFSFWESITILSMIVLGGIGSIPGVIIGAILLVGIPEILRQYSDYRLLVFGCAMILMMVLRPEGIWPSRIVSAELHRGRGEDTEAAQTETQPASVESGKRQLMAAILEIKDLTKHFGELKAVEKVSMSVQEGQIAAIIGPNGAGKTTLFNVITNTYRATSGEVLVMGKGTLGMPEFRLTELGVARTYQNIRLFDNMTALENVMVGMHCRTRSGILGAILSTPGTVHEEKRIENRALELMQFVGLEHQSKELAKNLPYGGQRRLEVARALATEPKLLLLDEPAAGMNPQEVDGLLALIRRIRATGVTVLLIEHHMKVVMSISENITVLNYGAKIAEGTPAEVQTNPLVIEAYLGTKRETGFARSRRHRDELRTDSRA